MQAQQAQQAQQVQQMQAQQVQQMQAQQYPQPQYYQQGSQYYNPQYYHNFEIEANDNYNYNYNNNYNNNNDNNDNYDSEDEIKQNQKKRNAIWSLLVVIILIIIVTIIVCSVRNNKINNKEPCTPPPLIPKKLHIGQINNPNYIGSITNSCPSIKLYKIESFNDLNRTMYTYNNHTGAISAIGGQIQGGFRSCKKSNPYSCFTYRVVGANSKCPYLNSASFKLQCVNAKGCYQAGQVEHINYADGWRVKDP